MKTPEQIAELASYLLMHLRTDPKFKGMNGPDLVALLTSSAGVISATVQAQVITESIRNALTSGTE